MFESFVIMLREGIEAALVIAIMLVVLKRSGRRGLERYVHAGVGLAVLASIGAAVALRFVPIGEEVYEGSLYALSSAFVISMLVWMHRNARRLKDRIETRVQRAVESAPSHGRAEAFGLGAFAFLMVFREGAEAVMFLSAVNLTTDAMLSFIGALLGLAAAVVFCVMFVRGSLHVNIRRFFRVTEWVLIVFVAQLVINGYHEFSEAGLLPASQQSMALVGPIVRNNSLFILALVAIPLFIWLTRDSHAPAQEGESAAERRLFLAKRRRERLYRTSAVACSFFVLVCVGVVYAREAMPKHVPPPEMIAKTGDEIVVPESRLADGRLHRFGVWVGDRLVRFLAMKTSDGKVHATLDACEICGTFGYLQQGKELVCLNCGAEINPMTLGTPGGCNPIPIENHVTGGALHIPLSALAARAAMFTPQPGLVEIDPVCGMKVKMNEAAGFDTFDGHTYYFCSEKCLTAFKANPKAYAK